MSINTAIVNRFIFIILLNFVINMNITIASHLNTSDTLGIDKETDAELCQIINARYQRLKSINKKYLECYEKIKTKCISNYCNLNPRRADGYFKSNYFALSELQKNIKSKSVSSSRINLQEDSLKSALEFLALYKTDNINLTSSYKHFVLYQHEQKKAQELSKYFNSQLRLVNSEKVQNNQHTKYLKKLVKIITKFNYEINLQEKYFEKAIIKGKINSHLNGEVAKILNKKNNYGISNLSDIYQFNGLNYYLNSNLKFTNSHEPNFPSEFNSLQSIESTEQSINNCFQDADNVFSTYNESMDHALNSLKELKHTFIGLSEASQIQDSSLQKFIPKIDKGKILNGIILQVRPNENGIPSGINLGFRSSYISSKFPEIGAGFLAESSIGSSLESIDPTMVSYSINVFSCILIKNPIYFYTSYSNNLWINEKLFKNKKFESLWIGIEIKKNQYRKNYTSFNIIYDILNNDFNSRFPLKISYNYFF